MQRIIQKYLMMMAQICEMSNVSVLGRDKGYTVKYTPFPEGVSSGFAIVKSLRSSLASPWKTLAFLTLLLRFRFYFQ